MEPQQLRSSGSPGYFYGEFLEIAGLPVENNLEVLKNTIFELLSGDLEVKPITIFNR